jgi:large subunit ribosomal protein L3
MSLKFMGKKQGMTQLFDEKGNVVTCTVIQTEPHVVVQVKEQAKDGYAALQLGAFKVQPSRMKRVLKPQKGHFSKAKVEPRKKLCESPIPEKGEYAVGQEIGIDYFEGVSHVDVIGVSKGKGYQGVIKRHNFAGGPASHGSGFHRHGGSCGMRTSPGRCLPGQKKAGRMGGEQVTVQSLKVFKIDQEKGLILVRGSIPGASGGLVYIQKAKKKG